MIKGRDGHFQSRDYQKILSILVFGMMFVYLLMQFRNVAVYYDDYGYYSLSYGVDNSNAGTSFSIAELIDFLRQHYMECNGRILGFFIWLLIYWIGDVPLVQISAAILTMGVLLAIWKFTAKRENRASSAIWICGLFGLFPIAIQRDGMYWLCPFFIYVAPILPLMIFLRMYRRNWENGFSLSQKILLTALVILSAFSQEQLAVSVLFMTIELLIWNMLEGRKIGFSVVLIATASLCVAILVLSPGILDRASAHQEPLMTQILNNTEIVIRLFFARSMKAFVILLFCGVAAMSVALFKIEKGWLRIYDLCSIGYYVFSVYVYCNAGMQYRMQEALNGIKLIPAGIVAACMILIQGVRYYVINKKIDRLVVFMMAAASIGCLCFVPELPFRLFTPSWLLLFSFLVDGMVICTDLFFCSRGRKMARILACFAMLFFSVPNALEIYHGYESNIKVHQYNDYVMMKAAAQERSGIPVERIYLKEVPYAHYTNTMIYYPGAQFVKPWILNYYGFQSDPELYFDIDIYDTSTTEGYYAERGSGVFVKVPLEK